MLSLVLFTACAQEDKKVKQKKQTEKKEQTIAVHSIHELEKVFNDLNYTSAAWHAGLHEVPRIYFSKIGTDWKKTSRTLPVKEKKNIFFRLLAPLVLMSNEEISQERSLLFKDTLHSPQLLMLAKKYRVVPKDASSITKDNLKQLKKRIDIIPLSLALAQGAEESGWGTSRFASQGNALFGLWDYSGKGMAPARQRKELGNYGLARYDTPLDSVRGYMFNINIGHAYKKLRALRQELRQKNQKITGWKLANTLDKYSERGQAYIDGLHNMMRYNKLSQADDAYLSKGPKIHLIKAD
jgi:uncharacterized FlgJ-related protein